MTLTMFQNVACHITVLTDEITEQSDVLLNSKLKVRGN